MDRTDKNLSKNLFSLAALVKLEKIVRWCLLSINNCWRAFVSLCACKSHSEPGESSNLIMGHCAVVLTRSARGSFRFSLARQHLRKCTCPRKLFSNLRLALLILLLLF